MIMRNVLVIGGSGFVGRHLVHRLSAGGLNVRVSTRRRERAKQLLVMPTVEVVETDVYEPNVLRDLIRDQDAVINLVGILRGGYGKPYGRGFRQAHVELPEKIAAAMRQTGVRRLLHMSALRCGADAPSGYLRSKCAGESVLRGADLDLTVFRPSVLFGAGDSFLSLFAALLRLAPMVPLACPQARFQPVWVEDVAAVIADSLRDQSTIGRSYELCGPRQYTLHELVAYVGEISRRRRWILDLPDALSWLQAAFFELVPGTPMSRDNYATMQLPSLCDEDCALPFGRVATALEAVAPSYIGDAAPRSAYHRYRFGARR
jgi:NADH dehydrogenase